MGQGTFSTTKDRSRRRRHRRRRLRNLLVGIFGPRLACIWLWTIRFRWCGDGLVCLDPRGRQSVIFAFWHQRLLGFIYTHRRRDVRILVSQHGDGELISRVVSALGNHVIRGSSTRGGSAAMRSLLREVQSGRDFAITPDGPRGPPQVFHPGVAYFAARSGLPVILGTISYARCWRLRTWDRLVIPCPFSRAVVHGWRFEPPGGLSDEDIEHWRSTLEGALRKLTEETDARFEELYEGGISTGSLSGIGTADNRGEET